MRSLIQMSSLLHATLLLSFIVSLAAAGNDCQPSTWTRLSNRDVRPTSAPTVKASSVTKIGNITTGEINCRFWIATESDVNYYTCTQLADTYQITIEKFFLLNPDVSPDCSNIQADTEYCLDGCEYWEKIANQVTG